MPEETNSMQLDEERRQASHQEVKATIDGDVNARIKRESAQVEPKESAELAGVALVVYILLHTAINGVFRIIAHRKLTV